ncbi:MAG: type II secretion system protein [Phycisphaerales bacterium]
MTHGRRTPRRAFTLVEILIVVVILGILAAIVIPQFTNASQEASASSLKSMLQTARSQIELFRVKNNGTLPGFGTAGAAADWDPLVDPVDGSGTAWSAGGTVPPYLQAAPVNPFTGSAGIGTADATTIGWVWDAALGQMTAPYFDETTNSYNPP